MSLHDELIGAALDVLEEVQGTPDALVLIDAADNETPLAALMIGEIKVDPQIESFGNRAQERVREETRQVKVRGPQPVDLHGKVRFGNDPTAWSVSSASGGETSVVIIDLVRPWTQEVLRQGRRP